MTFNIISIPPLNIGQEVNGGTPGTFLGVNSSGTLTQTGQLVVANDSAPQLDVGMRGLTTQATSETNIYITTTNQAGACGVFIAGHSSNGAYTATFWVRVGSVAGTIIATASTTATTATALVVGNAVVTSGETLYWDASISNALGTATIDSSPLVTSKSSFALVARFIAIPSTPTNQSIGVQASYSFPPNNTSTIRIQLANISTSNSYYITGNGYIQQLTFNGETELDTVLSPSVNLNSFQYATVAVVGVCFGFNFIGDIWLVT